MQFHRQSPLWRFGAPRAVLIVAVLLVATACSLNSAPEGVNVAGGPPVVRLISPATNATYLEGVPVNIQASVSNAGEDIDRVEVSVDNSVVTTLPQPNANGLPIFSVTHTWPAAGTGSHILAVTAFRADGSASEPATVTINIISPVAAPEQTEQPTVDSVPTQPPADAGDNPDAGDGGGEAPAGDGGDNADNSDAGDNGDGGDEGGDEPDNTGAPMATFTQGVNVRRGPSTNFNPPIGSFAANQTAEIVGINPAGDWYKVRYYNADGWVFASLLTVSGDTSNIPVDPGPPTPIPATATPIPPTGVPATAVPQSQANLVAGNIRLDPSQPTCRETFNVRVDLANLGSQDTTTTGTFTIQDLHNGSVQAETQGPIPIIEDGKTVESASIPLTVNTFYNETHTIVVILNPSGSIPESGSGDNRRELQYTLQKGDC